MLDITPYQQCINDVHPAMIQKIIKVESNNNLLAINVNKKAGHKPKYKQPKTKADAIQLANYYIRLGHSVDLGYMQVNSNNLKKYGVTVNDMFNPCKNIAVGSTILLHAYQRALKSKREPQVALRHALSIYNTGNMTYGFKNGYVKKYTGLSTVTPPKAYATATTVSLNGLYD
ncbi:lytic transglycosylase domain-containing protein [Photobacterium leiognathi]|uniref:lytic transglycosylase domain-containing protein n=2 Tax=Photobacterium leiognathi TaxID=553611 RepID=UPI002738E39E|nr:lytic transglycosylase domain-containing protein [Photobacterium leiognathi]